MALRHLITLSSFFLPTMQITLYKSALCPRCYLAKKYLIEAIANNTNATVEEIEILTSAKKMWRDGIRMIPSIKIDGDLLSSVYLNREAVVEFINKHSTRQ